MTNEPVKSDKEAALKAAFKEAANIGKQLRASGLIGEKNASPKPQQKQPTIGGATRSNT